MTEPNPAATAAQRLVLAVLAAELRNDQQGSALLVADTDSAVLRAALVCACAGIARIAEGRQPSSPETDLVDKVTRRLLELECEPDE